MFAQASWHSDAMDKARLARATLNEKALDNIFSEYEHQQKKTPGNDASWDRWDFPDVLPAKTSWHLAPEEDPGGSPILTVLLNTSEENST